MIDYVVKLSLDINCAKNQPVINAAQFDKGRKMEITVTADGNEYDISECTAVLRGVRSNKTHFALSCEISDNKVIVETDEDTLSTGGVSVAKLVLSDSARVYSTQMFLIDTDDALEGNVTKSDSYSILIDLIEQVKALQSTGSSGSGMTSTQVQALLADKEDTSNRVTSFTQAFTDESGVKYPTVLALLKYLSDYYYEYTDIYDVFDGIRIDDNGNLIILLPDGEEKSLGSVKGTVKCSEIGLTADDANSNNFDLLCKAILTFDKVIVDDLYMLKNTTAYDINKNVALVAVSPDCGFDLSEAVSPLFNVGDNCNQISINNLTLKNTVDSLVVLFTKSNYSTTRMQAVTVNGCRINGRLSPIRFYQSTDVNPDEVDIGVDVISITNNTVCDCRASCFVLQDVSFNMLNVSDNIIKNYDNVFVNSAVTNTGAYHTAISANKKLTVVERNDIRCDDDWYHDESSTSMYYTFILGEGEKCLYRDNKIIGMKSNVDVALYDAYLSFADVTYENNFWKNNCVFVETTNNVLMKAKGTNEAESGKRKYYNNTFIVERTFYEAHEADENCVVYMISNTSLNEWDVQGNYIDVYRLAGFTSSAKVTDFTFKNNVVKVDKWVNGFLLAGVEGANVVCADNTVCCVDGTAFAGFYSGSYKTTKFIFNNNMFTNCRYPLGSGLSELLVINNNTFIDDQSVNNRLSSYGVYDEITGVNNKVAKKNGFFSPFNGGFGTSIDYALESSFAGPFSDVHIVTFAENSSGNVLIEFDGAVTGSTYTSFRGYIIIDVAEGYIRYTSTNDELITQSMSIGTTVMPKVIMTTGNSLPFDVLLVLSVDSYSSVAIKTTALQKIIMTTRLISTDGIAFYVPESVDLPDEYQRVWYIESDGSQYIDTGVLASDYADGISYVYEGVITNLDTGVAEYLWGALDSGKRSGNISLDDTNMMFALAAGSASAPIIRGNMTIGEQFKLAVTAASSDPNNATLSVNDVSGTYTGNTAVTSSDMPIVNIHLLKVNGSSATQYAQAQIFAFKMFAKDSTPIRNFVPCYRVADDVIGLYDMVEGQFYTNAGTGTFTKGDDI